MRLIITFMLLAWIGCSPEIQPTDVFCKRCIALEGEVRDIRNELHTATTERTFIEDKLYMVAKQQIKDQVELRDKVLDILGEKGILYAIDILREKNMLLPPEEPYHDDKCEGCEAFQHE